MEAEASSVPTCDIEHEGSHLDEDNNGDLSKASEAVAAPATPPPKSRLHWLYKNVCEEIDGTITCDSITPSIFPVSAADGFKTLCSYNWTSERNPTIKVPGGAPEFLRHAFPVKLEPDSGVTYRDLNFANNPYQPFQALFTALSAMSPKAKLDGIDVIISRSALYVLYKFANQGCTKSFRLQMNLVRNTLILTYKERLNKRRTGQSGQLPSWGHAFEEGFTTFERKLRGSVSHHRVITYTFGSLKVAVLHEVDASYSAPSDKHPLGPAASAASRPEALYKRVGNSNMDDLGWPSPRYVAVQPAGSGTAVEDVAELKARTISLAGNLGAGKVQTDTKPQCWFGRTPILIRGLHADGVFHAIKVDNFDFKEWAERHQQRLRKTVSLLETLRERTRSMGGCGVAILDKTKSNTRLEIWRPHRIFHPVHIRFIRAHWTPSLNVCKFRI